MDNNNEFRKYAVKHAGISPVTIPTWVTFGLVALALAAALLFMPRRDNRLQA